MKRKFEQLLESYTQRMARGGFYPGDFVKLKKDALSHPDVIGSEDYIEAVKALRDTDMHLRISKVSYTKAATPDINTTAAGYMATVYPCIPGGQSVSSYNYVTVPLSVLDKTGDDLNDSAKMPVPDQFKRKSKVNHTNNHKATADLQDDSYDSGGDFKKE